MHTILYTYFAQISPTAIVDWNNITSNVIAAIAVIVAVLAMRQVNKKDSKIIIDSKLDEDVFFEYKKEHSKNHDKLEIKVDKKAEKADLVFMQKWMIRVEAKLDEAIARK